MASKKRTMSNSSNSSTKPTPLIFRLPDQKPDVRLVVFDQEYHVHSMILKLYSNYFRKFLDSPDKSGKVTAPLAEFRYDYATAVDDDGMWALDPADKVQPIKPESLAALESEDQVSAKSEEALFRKLISAMYHRPYTIDWAVDIINLTRIADFYCALPIVSATLGGQLLTSIQFSKWANEHSILGMHSVSFGLIFAARKLRHEILFKECLVHLVDNLDYYRIEDREEETADPQYRLLCQDHSLYTLLVKHHNILQQKIMNANLEQIKFMQNPSVNFTVSQEAIKKLEDSHHQNAGYYRELQRQLAREDHHVFEIGLKSAISELLKNELVLDRSACGPGYEGPWSTSYLTFDLDTVVLPWDVEEIDW